MHAPAREIRYRLVGSLGRPGEGFVPSRLTRLSRSHRNYAIVRVSCSTLGARFCVKILDHLVGVPKGQCCRSTSRSGPFAVTSTCPVFFRILSNLIGGKFNSSLSDNEIKHSGKFRSVCIGSYKEWERNTYPRMGFLGLAS